MPKKKTSKVVKSAAAKKAKVPVKKSVAPVKKKAAVPKAAVAKAAVANAVPKPVAVKGAVGFRLRMDSSTHKQLQKMAQQKDVSINTMLNQLIKDAK